MKVRGLAHSLFVCTGMLKMAAILVPRAARTEWLEEWRAELWHVWHICNQNDGPAALHQKEEITAFSLGAFKDALWLRRNHASKSGVAPVVQAGDAFALHPDFCCPGSRKLADCTMTVPGFGRWFNRTRIGMRATW